jgi:biopolymer transport protein ExbD
MAGSAGGNELKAEPNLTPLLDVVFQLITFFMLVINFSSDNFDLRIKLPVAGSARPLDDASKANEDRLILNIDKEGHLLFNGATLTESQAIEKIKLQALFVRNSAKVTGVKVDGPEGLPTRVVIRADRDTPFSNFYGLVSACQTNGFHKFDLKAMTGQ